MILDQLFEAMKPSDIPPSMRDRLTMRDIEAERPAGAFRFRVTFDDGSHTDFMDFESARASADIEQGRISRLSETQAQHGRKAHGGKRSTARIDRILQLLRARNPQAQNDLEALILDFRGQQAQDRSDIARLDAENDMEEADIERLEAMLTQLKQRRGTAVAEATTDPQQNRAIVQSLVNPAAQSRMQQHAADFDKMLSQPGYDHRPGVKSELAASRQQQRQQWIDAVKYLQHYDDPLGVIRIALNKGITVDEVLKNLPAGMDLNALREQQGVAEAAPTEATQFYQQQYQREMQRHGSPRMAKEMASRATAQKFGPNWNIIMKQPGQPDRYATPADAEMLDRGRRELRDLMAKEDIAESLRDGEYHVATVTLDDGTVKKVRITSDEGFRDQIRKHFEKQGREVRDIDVDYSVRSELDEAKKKPQPTNPELWSRAKSAARSKFDVYPSAYANAWAAKWYKSKGGGWRMGKPKKD